MKQFLIAIHTGFSYLIEDFQPNIMKYLFLALICLAGCKTFQYDKRCRLKPDRGPCEGAIEKFYFDPVDKQCKAFTWGGCYGVVPFDFIEECLACSEDDT